MKLRRQRQNLVNLVNLFNLVNTHLMHPPPVLLSNYRTRLDAEMAGAILRGEGIPFILQSAEGMALGPMPGGASLLVSPDDLEAAREALGIDDSTDPNT